MTCLDARGTPARGFLVAGATLLCATAQAHEGHGLPGMAHWHGTDALGFVGALVGAAAVWFKGRP